MINLLLGISTLILCSLGFFYSWKYQTKNNFRIAILFLIICGFVLRIYIATDFYLHAWDERYHALVAKNLIQHPLKPTLYDVPVLPYDFKDWPANHIWLHKQPLPLWVMATSMWLFGINEIALRLPSIILTTLGIGLTFLIASYFFNKKVGYLSAFLYSINGLIIEITGGRVATDHIDIFFLFFVELAVFFTIIFVQNRKQIFNALAGISIGLAILSKWLPALIVIPLWLLIVIDSKQFNIKSIILNFTILIAFCTITFIPWQVYINQIFPLEAKWESSFNYRHITEVLEEQGGPFYYHLDKIRINYGELIYLPLAWFLWTTATNFKDLKRLSVCIWFLVPLLFFSFVKTKMQAYLLFTAPAIFIITAEFWFTLYLNRKNFRWRWLTYLVLFLLIALPIRYTIERIKPFENKERNPKWVTDLKELNNKSNFNRAVLFNYDKPIEAMFYTNLIAYSTMPDKEIINNLIRKGYKVFVNDNGQVHQDIRNIKGIEVLNLTLPDK